MRRLFLCLILFTSLSAAYAQKDKDLIESLVEDGEYYLEEKQYEKAYYCWGKLIGIDKKNELYYKLKKGISASHIPAKKDEAITLLEEVRGQDSTHYAIFFYLGEAYHHNYKFDQAIFYLEKFIGRYPDAKEAANARMYLLQAKNGKQVTQTMVEANITNLGSPVNSEDAEYVPVVSADESILLFTYRGKKSTGGLMDIDFKKDPDGDYYEDIFITKKVGDKWDEPKSIGSNINTKHNDASIALSPDGQELYTFYSSKKDGGDIYVCHLNGEEWSTPEKLGPNINTKYWEGSCSISGDGRHLYFASERPGGLGGKDIYVSEMQANGQWGPALNLGPSINTEFNDDSPFIHPDGITLFFSSEGHNSIGGFDIMYSIKKDDKWMSPANMGYPLNTTDDDIYYVINAKGDKGYFSSTRTGKGEKGSHDIYQVIPGVIGERPVLALLKGTVYGNDVPMEAEFKIIKASNGDVIGPFHSNKKSGKYLVALSPGEKYLIKVNAAGYPPHEEDLDVQKLNKFIEIKRDFRMVKGGFKDPLKDSLPPLNTFIKDTLPPVKIDSVPKKIDSIPLVKIDSVPKKIDSIPVIADADPCKDFKTLNFAELKRKSLNDPAVYAKLLEIGTKLCAKGMVFKVQIAAYKYPQNYKWDHLKEYGTPNTQKLADGITRFTQGEFASIHDAEKQRKGAISKGQTDAWITGWIDGKRYTLEELIMVDFYNKNISNYQQLRKELEEFMATR
jgi:hypothetical protein